MRNALKIDLWFWHLDASASDIARWRTILDTAELARMNRFLFDKDKTRFTICRSRMRRILGLYTSTAPRDILFTTTGRDKPVLASSNPQSLHFNLTHTDGLACLAIAPGEAVGVDLERLRPVEDDFIAYALNPVEHTRVLPLAPAARQQAFFRYWTAKEAYLKAIGTGLWQSLKTFDVNIPSPGGIGDFITAELQRIDDPAERARNWQLFTFQVTDHHFGALAAAPPAGTRIEIRTRWLGAAQTSNAAMRGHGKTTSSS